MGWLVAALVGAIIGALVEVSMRSDPVTNVLSGVAGALLANAAILVWGMHLGDPISFALAAAAGAPIMIGMARTLRSRPSFLG